jgi:hypothetical protein
MRRLGTAAVLISLIAALGCSGYQRVSEKEKEMLLKMRRGEYELVKSDVYEQLKKDAEIGRSVGRYQMQTREFRTWRLDTVTGESCLLLTTEADWKDPKIQSQMCR